MEPDFSGYATKAGIKCSDGRTIMPDAFRHQDKMRVPLVWQHGHKDPENVLGHAILENREDGVYAYGFFNDSAKGKHAKGLVAHGDITQLSIWANELIERSKRVLHGAIREVSLVLSGANPGAVIENVALHHADGDVEDLMDEAIIYSGHAIVHGVVDPNTGEYADEVDDVDLAEEEEVVYEEDDMSDDDNVIEHAKAMEDMTVQDVYDSMSQEQQDVLHYMVGEAFTAGEEAGKNDSKSVAQSNMYPEGYDMNVFEQKEAAPVLSHDDMKAIVADATKNGSLKDAVENYALSHGIEDIEVLFPEAQALANTPELFGRRTEWVNMLIGATRKSPFSRIKTISADITHDDARAKGYFKGNLKKEEFFAVTKRTTTPTTIYKKQKLDRDDVVDITDFDVVSWLKAEMRLMLDEEIARAILVGDGRDVSHDDKINEQNIRPIASDHELYTTTVNVNIDDSNSSAQEIIDAVVLNRKSFRGTGVPMMFTSETYIAKFLLLKDTMGRRLYRTLDELANELRVQAIVPVEILEDYPEIVGIMVNPVDYNIGADRGGAVSMFEDFDIDYNQQKYLIETRISGALTKLKSAIVIKKVAGSAVLVSPNAPAFNTSTGVLTITNQTGVVYKNGDTVVNAAGSPYAAIASGASITITATPASGYYFATSDNDSWTFTRD